MVETFKISNKEYLELGNVLDDPSRIKSLMQKIETRILKSCDPHEIEHLNKLLKELEGYLMFLS